MSTIWRCTYRTMAEPDTRRSLLIAAETLRAAYDRARETLDAMGIGPARLIFVEPAPETMPADDRLVALYRELGTPAWIGDGPDDARWNAAINAVRAHIGDVLGLEVAA